MKMEGIRADVRAFIDEKVEAGEIVQVRWIVHEIVASRSEIDGYDADFYRACAFEVITKVAKECIGKYEATPQASAQLVMDGFEYAQKAYPVERSGDRVLVPTDQMTVEELNARADEYERMAAGCRLHAKELRYLARMKDAA